jgi:hypothetical protein
MSATTLLGRAGIAASRRRCHRGVRPDRTADGPLGVTDPLDTRQRGFAERGSGIPSGQTGQHRTVGAAVAGERTVATTGVVR